jgi:hypothetical protein
MAILEINGAGTGVNPDIRGRMLQSHGHLKVHET